MTNREAIKILEMQLKCVEYDSCDCDCKACLYGMATETEDAEALKLAIAALEKQEPEEPDKHVTDEETWFCPRCHVAYEDVQPCYCFRCGQKLKWETWQYQIEF